MLPNIKRPIIALISLLACLLGMWTAGRAGFSPVLSDYAAENGRPDLAGEAVRLSPSDAQAHHTQAVVLSKIGRLKDAIKEFENAVALRPSDYVLWLDLAYARERNADDEGALAAFEEAARLAPNYARPRWDIGQLLLRAGRRDEAFVELRRAAASRPALLLEVIDIAWKSYGGDAWAVQQAIRPQTSREHLALARFIAEHGRTSEAIQLFRAAGEVPDDVRLSFLTQLLTAKRFKEAYEVWSSGQKVSDVEGSGGINKITDGSFESQVISSRPGFGWQLAPRVQALSISLDVDRTHAGAHSLLLHFGGDATTLERIVSQIVLVEPQARYRLSFAARTERLVTGGPPVMVVTDASGTEERTLTQSVLQVGTSEWRDYSVEISTTAATEAIVVAIQRQPCTSEQCPIFGSVWFDSFSLRKLL